MENINEYIVNTEWYPSNIVVMASLSVSTPGRSDKPSELRPYLELKKSKPRNCQRVVSFKIDAIKIETFASLEVILL